ncbi:glycosyltransferase family 4 protein [Phenylobacterium sp.]|uniref:glycosyltransferase family 4 protein n=1 Tax=Phenylobacterium sp. TaxID=1871053 RepID=UPI0027361DF9|nr:glycosyltransferase family 4 protein [Phenylobacterium sp.]MDP3660435.1 glycosyltransferase family 4 protein [Phenylobacterium sp.]
MPARLAIHHPPGRMGVRNNPFGMDVANFELFRALAQHGGYEALHVLSHVEVGAGEIDVLREGAARPPRLTIGSVLDQGAAQAAGVVLRGRPDLYDLAWLRRRSLGDRAFSLVGLIHTLAPPATRQTIGMAAVGPTQPWDALICTSPAVQAQTTQMFDAWGDYLAERFAGKPGPRPMLPLVPLGVDLPRLSAAADRPDARAALRARLGLGADDVLAIWVGRLSYFEKAFPQPMFRALEEAAQATGARVHFAMAGWFPEPENRAMYEAAARAYAPSVPLHLLDGNDRALLDEVWAGADIFLSLVDNIQETFGITPLEAMASGLPVVVSDWDGYRYTVRDGRDGFLIPTLGGPSPALGRALSGRHVMGLDSYQTYVGSVAQYTAVNVPAAAAALAELIRSPELRRRMGASGRQRVREAFDWPVVIGQLNALFDELTQIRAAAPDVQSRHRDNPLKGEPFADFAGFATSVLHLDMRLIARPQAGPADLTRAASLELDQVAAIWRATPAECGQALAAVVDGAGSVRAVLERFPVQRRRAVELGLIWMMKLGILDWVGG